MTSDPMSLAFALNVLGLFWTGQRQLSGWSLCPLTTGYCSYCHILLRGGGGGDYGSFNVTPQSFFFIHGVQICGEDQRPKVRKIMFHMPRYHQFHASIELCRMNQSKPFAKLKNQKHRTQLMYNESVHPTQQITVEKQNKGIKIHWRSRPRPKE